MKSRNTQQKEILESALNLKNNFFTAEELQESTNIGIATVYRFLKEKRNKRQLHSYSCERKIIYSKDSNNHCHYTCQKCGNIKHFNINSIDNIKKHVKGSICHFQIDVHGICEECTKKAENKKV